MMMTEISLHVSLKDIRKNKLSEKDSNSIPGDFILKTYILSYPWEKMFLNEVSR